MENVHHYIQNQLKASAQLKEVMAETMVDTIYEAASAVVKVLKANGKVLLCGNGGSAADSQHIAAELIGRFKKERAALPAIALTANTSILTCLGNDYGFDDIFKRQIEALGNKGDVLIGISTSGCSKNVLLAIEMAQSKEMLTIALVGGNDSPMKNTADMIVSIPSEDTPRIQEGHITFGHILCDLIEQMLFP